MNARIRRILVAVDASAPSHAALRAAAALAQGLDAQLEGLFVEDLELLHFAQLPFAREVGLASAARRALDAPAMERALNAQARRAQRAFEALGKQHGVRWSFRVVRGNVAGEILSAAAEVDVVALGLCGHMEIAGRRLGSTVRTILESAHCSVLIEHHRRPDGSTVLVLYDGSDASDRALERAKQLATVRQVSLIVALTGEDEANEALKSKVESMLAPGTRVVFDRAPNDTGELRALTARHDCDLVVVPFDNTLLSREPTLPSEVGRPMLLVR